MEPDLTKQSLKRNAPFTRLICLLLLVVAAPIVGSAQIPPTVHKYAYMLQDIRDTRKLADLNENEEIYAVTLTRSQGGHETKDEADFPKTVVMIVRTKKANEPRRFFGPYPAGSELAVPLIRRADGTYETIYYSDDTKRAEPRPGQLRF